jgi:hypothetical protein
MLYEDFAKNRNLIKLLEHDCDKPLTLLGEGTE